MILDLRGPLGDGKLRGISPTFSRSHPSADAAQAEFVPVQRLQIIAHELFIEAGGLCRRRIRFSARIAKIRCQTFVDQQFSIDDAKLTPCLQR